MPPRKKTSSDSTANFGFEVIQLDCNGGLRPSHEAKDRESATITDRRYSFELPGHVFECFLTQLPAPRARTAVSSTPRLASCVVRLLVEMLAPYKGRIYDPACGSGGMFARVQQAQQNAIRAKAPRYRAWRCAIGSFFRIRLAYERHEESK